MTKHELIELSDRIHFF